MSGGESLVDTISALAQVAGDALMAHYVNPGEVRFKADRSPVTSADRNAEALIVSGLRALRPRIPVIAEEESSLHGSTTLVERRFWLVDPLDGTREFLARNGEFTVNIALIEDRTPSLGVVFAPALGVLWAGGRGIGAWREDASGRRAVKARGVPPAGTTVVGSRSHADDDAMSAYLQGRTVAGLRAIGSSLKFCLLAEGEADLYPRFGRTMEWDTAAGHAVLLAAGGSVCELDGRPLRYGKPGFENPHFVASGLALA